MNKLLQKLIACGLYLFIFLLPWQTRWIWQEGVLKGGRWEYGMMSLYGTDILLLVILVLSLAIPTKGHKNAERFWGLILGFFLICFASIFWSDNKMLAWYAAGKLMEGILLVWLILRVSVNWRAMGTAFVASGLVQAGLGIYQFFSQNIMASKWLGLADHDPGTIGDYVVETASGRFLRAYGALPHPNMLAGFLVVCLIMLVGFILVEHRARKGRLAIVIGYSAAFAIMFFGLVLTFSRSAWLAFGLALVFLFIVAAWQRDQYRLWTLLRIFIWIFLLCAFSVLLLPNLWQTRVLTPGRLETKSSAERTTYLDEAKDLISKNWYQGVGIGNYTLAVYNQNTSKNVWDYQPVHNIYLLVTAETGVFGGLIFLLIVIEFLRTSFIRMTQREGRGDDWFLVLTLAFLALLLIGLFDHYLWSLSFGVLLFWLIFGLWLKRWVEQSDTTFVNYLVDKLFHR